MASKWEVLEYLRVQGRPVEGKEIVNFFWTHGGTTGLTKTLQDLLRERLIKKLKLVVTEYKDLLGLPVKDFVETNENLKKKGAWYALTERAFGLLRNAGIRSFYDHPKAKYTRWRMRIRTNPIYKRDFVQL